MVDAIIILIVIVLLLFALKGSIKHFKGEGSCCGGGGSTLVRSEDKKLTGPVIAERKAKIEGMHCENCSERVKRALDKIDGVSAHVDYKTGLAEIKMDRSVSEGAIKNAIAEAGYKVISIS